jgi:prepilin-type N-terminal cleavage/methylation domain-containing protein
MVKSRHNGFTLLEVLISLFILSYALLGFDLLELKSLKKSREIYFYGIAITQVQAISNLLQELNSNAGFSLQTTLWNQENKQVLPQGAGVVTGSYPDYQVSLSWAVGEGHTACLEEKVHV